MKKMKLQNEDSNEPRKLSARKRQKKDHHRLSFEKPKKCETYGCTSSELICFIKANDGCYNYVRHSSRWYHISSGEHFCNNCFDFYYRNNKKGYPRYLKWYKNWVEKCKTEPSLKVFLCYEILPYWIQCTKPSCKKWRSIYNDLIFTEVDSVFIANFQCRNHMKKSEPCIDPEDPAAKDVLQDEWIRCIAHSPLLHKSPASPFLTDYFLADIGVIPPTLNSDQSNTDLAKMVSETNLNFQPFQRSDEESKTLTVQPAAMDADEIQAFPEYNKCRVIYLSIRNLIIALWNINCKEWLTSDCVFSHIICRGLARIFYVNVARRLLQYLTTRGLINIGIVKAPLSEKILSSSAKSVLVIGAGAAGLAAARHLANFGAKVSILESENRIGGRVCDDFSHGKCIGKGAQVVAGTINNPITYMCEQTNTFARKIGLNYNLYDSNGKLVSPSVDSKVEMHFNTILDFASKSNQENDCSLLSSIESKHSELLKSDIEFDTKKNRVLQFYISNLELFCGTSLDNISSLNWNQNEKFPQFGGDHAIIPSGYASLFKQLSDGLDITFDCKVNKIDYSDEQISIYTKEGKQFTADKVLVTLPLSILQREEIEFFPPLSEHKQKAINNLGIGVIEKVVLKFDTRFWKSKIENTDFFGHVPANESMRGLFPIFYDLSCCDENSAAEDDQGSFFLMTYLCGKAVNLSKELMDPEIIQLCMEVLRGMFKRSPEDVEDVSDINNIPDPIDWFITHWATDANASMSFSYIKTGGSGEDYDTLAASIDDKVFFGGEATNRQHPQTVTGAYLSGIREAGKIKNILLVSGN